MQCEKKCSEHDIPCTEYHVLDFEYQIREDDLHSHSFVYGKNYYTHVFGPTVSKLVKSGRGQVHKTEPITIQEFDTVLVKMTKNHK